MQVSFYFDPSCPFSWIASRWLLVVQNQVTDLAIDWRPFALAIKNDEVEQKDGESSYVTGRRRSLRALRIMLAAQEKHGKDLLTLYSAFGMQKHIMFEELTDDILQGVLEELELPQDLMTAADSTVYDASLQQAIDEAVEVVGADIGVPTLVFSLEGGSRRGYFGPVLQSLPSKEDSLKIWQAISSLATIDELYEIKRSLPDSGPDTPSTARC